MPLLDGAEVTDWRDVQFCEYCDVQMIRGDRFKLLRYSAQGRVRLFDLHEDPREMRDMADDPRLRGGVVRDLERRLADHYAAYSVPGRAGTTPGGPPPTNATSPWVLAD